MARAWRSVGREGARSAAVAVVLLLGAGCGPTLHVDVVAQADHVAVSLHPLTAAGQPEWRSAGKQATLAVALPDCPAERLRPAGPEVLGHPARLVRDAAGARLELEQDWVRPVSLQRVGDGYELILTLRGETAQTRALDPDVTYSALTWCGQDGVLRLHLLLVAPRAVGRVGIVTAGESIRARKPVAELARQATAAINGGYFDLATGAALGALKVGGEWLRTPLYDRTALLLPRGGSPRIAPVTWRGEVVWAGRREPLDAYNSAPPADGRWAAYSCRWDGATTWPGWLDVACADPALRLLGREATDGPVAVELRSEPDVDGSILGAGPRLVRDGRAAATAEDERFRDDVTASCTARSAAGLGRDGSLYLAVADGTPPFSRGQTLADWAETLVSLGCVEALNLDGGPSSTLVVDGEVVNQPLGGAAAAVADALVVRRP